MIRNEEITSALIFDWTFALLSNFASQMTLNGCTQWLLARYRISSIVANGPPVHGLEIFWTIPKPGFSGWRDMRQLHGSNFLAQFARFVIDIAIRSLFSCKVRIYNTRSITSPYETPTDNSGHVSREHRERNNSRTVLMYTRELCDLCMSLAERVFIIRE